MNWYANRRSLVRALWVLLSCALLFGVTASAVLAQDRYALMIGANEGSARDQSLSYAVRDAHRLASLLKELGSFRADRVVLLDNPDADLVRSSLATMSERIQRESPQGSLLFVFYSGHADTLNMHLGSSKLAWNELRTQLQNMPSDLRILVLDACRSGRVTRVKGSRISSKAPLPLADAPAQKGLAIVSSATENEDAQESDEIQASFFTHHFVSALQGAADSNADGKVSLTEAYRYTADRTIASTASSMAGVQHPTYRYELRGRADVILTQPSHGTRHSALTLHAAGQYIVHHGDAAGPIVLESNVGSKPVQIWLSKGDYFIRHRTAKRLRQGKVTLPARSSLALDMTGFEQVQYGQYVRKGGAGGTSWSTSLWAGLGNSALKVYSSNPSLAISAALDLEEVTLDVDLSAGRSELSQPAIKADLIDTALTFAARKVFDLSRLSLSGGLGLSLHYLHQSFETDRSASTRNSLAPALVSLLRAELQLGAGLFLGARGSLHLIKLSSSDSIEAPNDEIALQATGWLGAGKYF